jgi:hypothetical protein
MARVVSAAKHRVCTCLLCHVVARSLDGQQDALSAACKVHRNGEPGVSGLAQVMYLFALPCGRAALMASRMLSVPPARCTEMANLVSAA